MAASAVTAKGLNGVEAKARKLGTSELADARVPSEAVLNDEGVDAGGENAENYDNEIL